MLIDFFECFLSQEQPKPEENKEEKKTEEKPEEEQKKEEKEEPKPPPPLVLFIDLHCVGCAKKIEKSLMKIRGLFFSFSLLHTFFFFFF